MSRACTKLDEVVAEILQIVADDKTESCRADDGAEYFFRGEKCNYKPYESTGFRHSQERG